MPIRLRMDIADIMFPTIFEGQRRSLVVDNEVRQGPG
jgi:hypothetical protein